MANEVSQDPVTEFFANVVRSYDRTHWNNETEAVSVVKAEILHLVSEAETPKSWRCFFCDEVFHDHESAAAHFGHGNYESDIPVCIEAATTPLQDLVKTNREMWERLLKVEMDNENLEHENACYRQVARKLSGKAEASWHDLAADGSALVQRERDNLAGIQALLAHIVGEVYDEDPEYLLRIWQGYDPLLVSPQEYLESIGSKRRLRES